MDEKKLVWGCRRGVKELDVMFTRFLQDEYPHLSDELKSGFHNLLDEQDPIILDYLFNRATAEDKDVAEIIVRLQSLF